MKIMDKMMGFMMDKMDKDEKKEMMDKMMDKFLSDMTKEDKKEMMNEMMPKMMKDINIMEMMPQMMMKMMSNQKNSGSASDSEPRMDGMCPEFDFEKRLKMMSTMMPKCMDTMFSKLESEERSRLVKEMLGKMAEIFEKYNI